MWKEAGVPGDMPGDMRRTCKLLIERASVQHWTTASPWFKTCQVRVVTFHTYTLLNHPHSTPGSCRTLTYFSSNCAKVIVHITALPETHNDQTLNYESHFKSQMLRLWLLNCLAICLHLTSLNLQKTKSLHSLKRLICTLPRWWAAVDKCH